MLAKQGRGMRNSSYYGDTDIEWIRVRNVRITVFREELLLNVVLRIQKGC